ncbi:methyltransferase domain-containing protein [Blastochloris viridis]|uniref:Biotin biosynthesis protein BioC n=1 Tax=Blastochloris viridis TaxID=1079 RepID=A0A0H5BBY1_BLAVI|nr:methyltransferase domain-containing protein [Blastochloris viridis]ALK08107.1 biotin biosynthesis protein BioC [Blastochloris viridis]BAR98629.1 SAM-dependent methyltransferase [Blastochloris viridis]CUU44029.1 biotin biosynthesis protein BioC [Blastochloris viridis]
MTPHVFDRAVIRRRRVRALALGPADFLVDLAAGELSERLAAVTRRFAVAADIGTPTEAVTSALRASGQIDAITRLDLLAGGDDGTDGAALPFAPASLDLAVSALALQFVNDLPGLLVQIRRALKPDGLFLAALIGGDSLTELRQAFTAAEAETTGGVSPRVAPFAEVRELGALLQRAGFALPVADVDRLTVRYATPLALMAELRRMGAANPLVERRRAPLRRASLIRAAELYAARFADPDGRIRATFDIVWLSGWAPHESQQQPLKPGTAQMRLADALGAVEHGPAPKR